MTEYPDLHQSLEFYKSSNMINLEPNEPPIRLTLPAAPFSTRATQVLSNPLITLSTARGSNLLCTNLANVSPLPVALCNRRALHRYRNL